MEDWVVNLLYGLAGTLLVSSLIAAITIGLRTDLYIRIGDFPESVKWNGKTKRELKKALLQNIAKEIAKQSKELSINESFFKISIPSSTFASNKLVNVSDGVIVQRIGYLFSELLSLPLLANCIDWFLFQLFGTTTLVLEPNDSADQNKEELHWSLSAKQPVFLVDKYLFFLRDSKLASFSMSCQFGWVNSEIVKVTEYVLWAGAMTKRARTLSQPLTPCPEAFVIHRKALKSLAGCDLSDKEGSKGEWNKALSQFDLAIEKHREFVGTTDAESRYFSAEYHKIAFQSIAFSATESQNCHDQLAVLIQILEALETKAKSKRDKNHLKYHSIRQCLGLCQIRQSRLVATGAHRFGNHTMTPNDARLEASKAQTLAEKARGSLGNEPLILHQLAFSQHCHEVFDSRLKEIDPSQILEDISEAEKSYKKAIRRSEKLKIINHLSYNNLGYVLNVKGCLLNALGYDEKEIEQSFRDAEIALAASIEQIENENFGFSHNSKLYPKSNQCLLYSYWNSNTLSPDYERAIRIGREVIEEDPEYAEGRNDLALPLVACGLFAKDLSTAEREQGLQDGIAMHLSALRMKEERETNASALRNNLLHLIRRFELTLWYAYTFTQERCGLPVPTDNWELKSLIENAYGSQRKEPIDLSDWENQLTRYCRDYATPA